MDADARLPGAGGAWTAGVLVVAITLLSMFTFAEPEGAQEVRAGRGFTYLSPEGEVIDPETLDDADLAALSDEELEALGLDPSSRSVLVEAGTEGSGGEAGRTIGGGSSGGGAGGPGGSGPGGTGPGGSGPGGTGGQAQGNYDCSKNQNAGGTDIGVTGREIRLAATTVRTGVAKSFLSDAEFGVEAVIRKKNRAGGVCGRLLKVDYRDDGWNPATGSQIISKWIGEKQHFGLIVNPSSEGLDGAIRGGLIRENQFPVVGADGMLIGQYRDPWVWPVATSTHSVMQIMVNDAFERGARTFGIVWENNFRFGVEGQYAFTKTVERRCTGVSGCGVVADQQIKGGEGNQYRTQADDFLDACGSDFKNCDFVALLLEPATAFQWRKDNGLGSGEHKPRHGIGAPQPLFVNSFVRQCGQPCRRMWAWTSFKPPLHPFDRDPKVVEYVRDLQAVSRSADASNPHVQGAFVGASLMVEALERLGPAPTRQGLRQVLDGMTFDSGLAPPLKFSPGNHFSATSAQAFEAMYNKDTFTNWQHVQGFIEDKEVHVDQLR